MTLVYNGTEYLLSWCYNRVRLYAYNCIFDSVCVGMCMCVCVCVCVCGKVIA